MYNITYICYVCIYIYVCYQRRSIYAEVEIYTMFYSVLLFLTFYLHWKDYVQAFSPYRILSESHFQYGGYGFTLVIPNPLRKKPSLLIITT